MTIKTFLIILCIFMIHSLSAQDVIDLGDLNKNIKLTNDGWMAINSGEYQKAITLFEDAIQLNPNNADSYTGAATAYLKLDQYTKAKSNVDSALHLTENQSDIFYLAGNINFRLGSFSEAVLCYTQALKNNDQSDVKIDETNSYFNRGNAHLGLGEYNEALSDYNIVLSQDPYFADAYHNRGVALKKLSRKEEACRDFDAAKHFGSQKSDRYIKSYCTNVTYPRIDYSAIEGSN